MGVTVSVVKSSVLAWLGWSLRSSADPRQQHKRLFVCSREPLLSHGSHEADLLLITCLLSWAISHQGTSQARRGWEAPTLLILASQ